MYFNNFCYFSAKKYFIIEHELTGRTIFLDFGKRLSLNLVTREFTYPGRNWYFWDNQIVNAAQMDRVKP